MLLLFAARFLLFPESIFDERIDIDMLRREERTRRDGPFLYLYAYDPSVGIYPGTWKRFKLIDSPARGKRPEAITAGCPSPSIDLQRSILPSTHETARRRETYVRVSTRFRASRSQDADDQTDMMGSPRRGI